MAAVTGLVFAASAFADAGNPVPNTIQANIVAQTATTLTIGVKGQWQWQSHGSDCNTDRAATGAGIAWGDRNGADNTRTITTATHPNATTARVTTSSNHGFLVGDHITVSGVVGGTGFNGTFTITAVTANTATYASAGSGTGSGGTVVDTDLTNGWLVTNGSIKQYIGTKTATTAGAVTNPIDREVHPVDLGNQATTPTLPGNALQQAIHDDGPAAGTGLGNGVTWKGGCGRIPVTSTGITVIAASKTGNVVTLTTSAPTGIVNGDPSVQVAGMFGTGGYLSNPTGNNDKDLDRVTAFNVSGNTFSYNAPNAGDSGTSCNSAATCKGKVTTEPWGSWGYQALSTFSTAFQHTYLKSMLPEKICVNFYDVHGGGTTASTIQVVKGSDKNPPDQKAIAGEIQVDPLGGGNKDNSINTNDFDVNNGANCIAFTTPTLTTDATASATVGGNISDTAHLGNVAAGTGGTITFQAFKRTDPATAVCSGTAAFTSAAIPVNGPGDYLSGNFATTAAGKYDWVATYSGTGLVLGVTSACPDSRELSDVAKKQPTVTTDAGGPFTIGTDGKVKLKDTATLSGAFTPLTGNIVFKLYSNDTCTTQVGSTSTKAVTTNGSVDSDEIEVTAAGTYYWIANYTGDDNNFATTNACKGTNESPVVNPRTTSITTDAGGPYTLDPVNGNDLADKGTISGGTDNAGGNLTFKLYSDGTCATQVGSTVNPTDGNPISSGANGHQYTSNSVHVATAGTYHWRAFYSGDTNNTASNTPCLDTNENPQVLTPSIDIQKTPNNQTKHVGETASFTITVTNTGQVALSDVKVTDANSSDCARTAAQVAALLDGPPGFGNGDAVFDAGESFNYTCSSPTFTAADGTAFHNQADTEGTSQGVKVTDTDGADVEIIHPEIDITKNPKSQSVVSGGTATWTIVVTNTGDTPLTNVIITDAQAPNCAKTAAQTAAILVGPPAVGNGDAVFDQGESFTYTCTLGGVTSSFTNIIQVTGDDKTGKTVTDDDTAGGPGPPGCTDADHCGSVTVLGLTTNQDFVPNDTANISGLVGVSPGGSITFKLFKEPAGDKNCPAANEIFTATVPVSGTVGGAGSFSTSNAALLSALVNAVFPIGALSGTGGNYNWKVSYSGDAATNNAAVTGACGTENFQVANS